MPLPEPRCTCPGAELTQVREDYQSADRAAQFRVSDRAFYYPAFPVNRYIPFSCLTGVTVRRSSLPTIGCCGKELPVLKLTLCYAGGELEQIIDPPKHVDTILTRICAARPDLAPDDRR